MPFSTIAQARQLARAATVLQNKSDASLLREARDTSHSSFDIFLCHAKVDAELVLGAKLLLEKHGLSVYVDWIDDPHMDHSAVTKENAARLRVRMQQCNRLFYLHTPNAALSKWCPWELGFFDGKSHPQAGVYIFPLIEAGASYRGQEYLALYEPVELENLPPPVRRLPSRVHLPPNIRFGPVIPFGTTRL